MLEDFVCLSCFVLCEIILGSVLFSLNASAVKSDFSSNLSRGTRMTFQFNNAHPPPLSRVKLSAQTIRVRSYEVTWPVSVSDENEVSYTLQLGTQRNSENVSVCIITSFTTRSFHFISVYTLTTSIQDFQQNKPPPFNIYVHRKGKAVPVLY
jgi:hypothetical protein